MIGKVTRSTNFHRIAQYIFGKPQAEPLIESVPEGKTLAQKVAAMEFVASRNRRVKRPAYHLSLSPAEGDNLRNVLFHGEIVPDNETNKVYEPAYHILYTLIQAL